MQHNNINKQNLHPFKLHHTFIILALTFSFIQLVMEVQNLRCRTHSKSHWIQHLPSFHLQENSSSPCQPWFKKMRRIGLMALEWICMYILRYIYIFFFSKHIFMGICRERERCVWHQEISFYHKMIPELDGIRGHGIASSLIMCT